MKRESIRCAIARLPVHPPREPGGIGQVKPIAEKPGIAKLQRLGFFRRRNDSDACGCFSG